MRFRYNCATPKCLAALPGVHPHRRLAHIR
jgi:hypothetical protein